MMYIYENIFKDRISAGATDFLSRKDLTRLYANKRYRKMRGAPDVSVEDMIKQFKYFLEQLVSAEWRRGLVNHYGVSIMDQIEKKLTYGAREWYILQLMIKTEYHDELGYFHKLLGEKTKDNSF